MTSTIKVNNIQNQCGANIINENSNTITIGASGDTIALASGASQTGFGRTGTVDWQTGSIKTTTFTAANGEGYFADTSSGAITMNLPAGTAGNIVSVVDYTNTFQTNNLTITPNGSQKIGGVAASFIADTEGQSLTFVYVDDTEGWKNIQDSTTNAVGNANIIATGGNTVATCGNCKIHTFTGPGTFTVSQAASCAANNVVSYVIVAGGGGGGAECAGGGGGAGGYREVKSPTTPFTASPLDGYPTAPNRVTLTAQSYAIVVGGGGTAGSAPGSGGNGNNSSFGGITAAAGGGGGGSPPAGSDGGSGGGGAHNAGSGGTGNTPPVTPAQGTNGAASAPVTGSAPSDAGGGGGGATQAGIPGPTGGPRNHNGGAGATSFITGSSVTRAGGGGGSNRCGGGADDTDGGDGGGGKGGYGPRPGPAPQSAGQPGTANSGGGGGAGKNAPPQQDGGTGGSGIVIIRYKFQ